MKNDTELLTRAQLIRNETGTGDNTAERVGEHLEDMVDRLGRADVKQPDANKQYLARVPVVTFKFDDFQGNHALWPTHFQAYSTARVAAGKHQYIDNAPDIPGTLAGPSEWPKEATALLTKTDLVFDATDESGYYTITSATGGFLTTAGLAWNMMISFEEAAAEIANNLAYFVIYSLTDTVITVYPAPNTDFSSEMASEDATGHTVLLYRGRRHTTTTWVQLQQAIDKHWTLAGHGKTHRNMGTRSGWPVTTDAELWDEVTAPFARFREKLTDINGDPYEVKHFIVPFGVMYDKTPTFIRQAGWLSNNAYSQSGLVREFVHGGYDPWHTDEENTHTLVNVNNALTGTGAITAAGDTLTGDGTNFDGEGAELAVGDIIAVCDIGNGIYQVRRVASIASDTSLTVDSAWGATIASGATIYKCSAETAGNGFDIGNINYIAEVKGWYQVAQHVPYSTQNQFNPSPYAAILDYIDYLNEDGAGILIRDRDAAYEIHKPLLEAGIGFAVNPDGVMIRRARGRNFTILDNGATVLGAPAAASKADDEYVTANRFTVYLNEAQNKLYFRVCYVDGTTYKTGEIALT